MNVFTSDMLRELANTLRSDEVTRANVVVLGGTGTCWSAGLDVGEHLKPAAESMLKAFRETLEALWSVPVPTIGRVHGACLGGGLELLSLCDLALASQSASFGQPEIKLGVFPPLAAAHFPCWIGDRQTAELLYLGETIGAEHAQQVGLVNRVVPDDALDKEVEGLAATLAGRRRQALVYLKKALRRSLSAPWTRLKRAERIYLEDLMSGEDAEEGLKAFLEKRRPVWKEI